MTKKTKETHTAGGIVLNPEGQMLVVSQNNNSWSLPKGHIDPGEDALTSAKREIYEESGIPMTALQLEKEIGHYQRYKIGLDGGDDLSELKNITVFLFKTTHMDLQPIDKNNPEARWMSPQTVPDLLTHAKDKEFVERYLKTAGA